MLLVRSLLPAVAILCCLATQPKPAEAAKNDQRVDRNLRPSTLAGPKRPAIPVDGLTTETGTLAVTVAGVAETLQSLTVTPPGPGPFPLAVISHGSPRDPAKRRDIRLRAYLPIAEDFARRGYKAIVFARRGYAGSSGSFAESNGNCSAEDFAAGAAATAEDYRAVIAAAAKDPTVNARAVVAVGQSAGGFGVDALAGLAPRGLIGVISFAGGRGSTKDFANCNADGLSDAFDMLGRSASVPALWLYSTADRYFWPDLVHRNLEAFTANGAPVRLEMVGPLWYSRDGHELFDLGGRTLWRPRIDAFLDAIGAPNWTKAPDDAAVTRAPAPGGLSKNGKARWLRYLGSAGRKAFAVGPASRFGWASHRDSADAAVKAAIDFCQASGDTCRVVSIDGARQD